MDTMQQNTINNSSNATNSQQIMQNYTQATKMICIYFSIIVFAIFIFILSPLNEYMVSKVATVGILIVIIWLIYFNVTATKQLSGISTTNPTNPTNPTNATNTTNTKIIQTNIITNHIFSFILIVLCVFIVRYLLIH